MFIPSEMTVYHCLGGRLILTSCRGYIKLRGDNTQIQVLFNLKSQVKVWKLRTSKEASWCRPATSQRNAMTSKENLKVSTLTTKYRGFPTFLAINSHPSHPISCISCNLRPDVFLQLHDPVLFAPRYRCYSTTSQGVAPANDEPPDDQGFRTKTSLATARRGGHTQRIPCMVMCIAYMCLTHIIQKNDTTSIWQRKTVA